MRLNSLTAGPKAKSKRRRVGRGMGSGFGKTCGRGHKGQRSRSGGYHKIGFEGGQMPLQRRLPKFGFSSYLAKMTMQVRLDTLALLDVNSITLDVLKTHNVIPRAIKRVKVIQSGTLNKAIVIKGLRASRGARKAIEALGGRVED